MPSPKSGRTGAAVRHEFRIQRTKLIRGDDPCPGPSIATPAARRRRTAGGKHRSISVGRTGHDRGPGAVDGRRRHRRVDRHGARRRHWRGHARRRCTAGDRDLHGDAVLGDGRAHRPHGARPLIGGPDAAHADFFLELSRRGRSGVSPPHVIGTCGGDAFWRARCKTGYCSLIFADLMIGHHLSSSALW